MKQKMNFLTFILAGIRNRPGRNLATAFCFAFIAANIFSGQYLAAGAAGSIDQGVSRMGADILVAPLAYMVFLKTTGPDNTVAIVRTEPTGARARNNIMDTINTVSGVAVSSPQLYVGELDNPALSASTVRILGIDPVTDFTIRPWLQHPLGKTLGPGEVIAGNNIRGGVSSTISLYGTPYTIAGKLDPTRSDTDNSVFLRMDDAYALASREGAPKTSPPIREGEINAVMIRASPGVNPDKVIANLKRHFSRQSYIIIGRHFTLDPVSQDIRGLPDLLNYISAVMILAAFPLIALIAALVANERRREIGLLRSMGAGKKAIFFLILGESLTLAAAGGLPESWQG